MKLQNLSYKTLFTIFFFAIAGIIFLIKIGGNVDKAEATWWNASWLYRRSIGITNSSGVGQSNVLVKVLENYDLSSLVSASKLQSDLDDIRLVTSDDGTTISYYITDSTNASVDIWARIPSLSTSGTSIWMYYGNSSATAVSAIFYTYTGSQTLTDDGSGKLRIKFLTSGTLVTTANMRANEVFLVGGGGGGGGHGGGGGGYTSTQTGIGITLSTNYPITIGAGGAASTNTGGTGGTTSAFSYSASGGFGGYENGTGGAGGSGGGGGSHTTWGGYGGANGANGQTSGQGTPGGAGQGTTTKAFGDATETAYSGGGGGEGSGAGGIYGGGIGGRPNAAPGIANSGGGGGGQCSSALGHGGSGIVIIRYTSPTSISLGGEEVPTPTPTLIPTPTPISAPSSPSTCLIDQGEDNTVFTLKWADNSSNEDGFKVYKNGTLLATLGAGVTNYADSPITPGTSYAYRVVSYSTVGGTSPVCDFPILNPGLGSLKFEGF